MIIELDFWGILAHYVGKYKEVFVEVQQVPKICSNIAHCTRGVNFSF